MGRRARANGRGIVININSGSSIVLALCWALWCIALPTAVLIFVYLERSQVRSSAQSPAPSMPPPASPIAKSPDQPSDEKEQIVVIPEAIDSFAAVASFYGGAVPDLTPVVLPPVSL